MLPAHGKEHVGWCLTNLFCCRCGDPKAEILSDPVLYLSQFYGWYASDVHLHLTLLLHRQNRSLCRHGNGVNVQNGRQCETVASPISRGNWWLLRAVYVPYFFCLLYRFNIQKPSDVAWCGTRSSFNRNLILDRFPIWRKALVSVQRTAVTA